VFFVALNKDGPVKVVLVEYPTAASPLLTPNIGDSTPPTLSRTRVICRRDEIPVLSIPVSATGCLTGRFRPVPTPLALSTHSPLRKL